MPPVASRSSRDDDALSLLDGVVLDFDGVGAVFQGVNVFDGGARELAFLAHHDETVTQFQGQGGGHQEAP